MQGHGVGVPAPHSKQKNKFRYIHPRWMIPAQICMMDSVTDFPLSFGLMLILLCLAYTVFYLIAHSSNHELFSSLFFHFGAPAMLESEVQFDKFIVKVPHDRNSDICVAIVIS